MTAGCYTSTASVLAEADSALLIDCRSLEHFSVPLALSQSGLSLVVVNSGVKRGLLDSEYNLRRQECEAGVALLPELEPDREITHLRDVDTALLSRHAAVLPEVVARRCRHVVSENERVLARVRVLRQGNFPEFGKLVNASHASLRDDFEVSHRDVDVLVELTQAHVGTLGARMTGAGFGGCIVALMRSNSIGDYRVEVLPQYERLTGNHPDFLVCRSASGANVLCSR